MSEETQKKSATPLAGLSDREKVERTADRLRDELLLTIEELDRRRERALDVKFQLGQAFDRNRDLLVKVGGAVVGAVAVGVVWSMWRARHREELVWERRGEALRRAWRHPDRVASSAKQKPLAQEVGTRLLLIFGTALATALAKNAVHTLVPPPADEQPRAQAAQDKPSVGLQQLMKNPAHA